MEDNIKNYIEKLVKKFNKFIPDDEKDLSENFRDYLNQSFEIWKNNDSKFIPKEESFIYNYLNEITEEFIKISLDNKKRKLIKDDNYEEIVNESGKIYNIGLKILNNEEVDCNIEDIESQIKKMQEKLDLVCDFNKEDAKRQISEAICDFSFIQHPEKDICSLRLGHIKKDFQENELKEEEEER